MQEVNPSSPPWVHRLPTIYILWHILPQPNSKTVKYRTRTINVLYYVSQWITLFTLPPQAMLSMKPATTRAAQVRR